MTPEFKAWPKIPRLNRDMTITEKIDGTNACVIVAEDGSVHAQSRKRIITPGADNFGFAGWVTENAEELATLGEGYHFGEWYGRGIQRGYGLDHKRFALFNWTTERPSCCDAVPVLLHGSFGEVNALVAETLTTLRTQGSLAAPGFGKPEGIVVRHNASGHVFKVLLEGDELPKGIAA